MYLFVAWSTRFKGMFRDHSSAEQRGAAKIFVLESG